MLSRTVNHWEPPPPRVVEIQCGWRCLGGCSGLWWGFER
ncbi:hypothetical protein Gohar_013144 [Gossypium harknessii]|uniref:Uncharacterized protein n=1 Tax=Gossypium harknessii TaxID=34285 RepID=A0A7J9GZW8_9ROSI|nr:hypothetical protein [Gossypium harknessii]